MDQPIWRTQLGSDTKTSGHQESQKAKGLNTHVDSFIGKNWIG
jgi:hypothetical protein